MPQLYKNTFEFMAPCYENNELYDAVRSYVIAAIELSAERLGTKFPSSDWSMFPFFPFGHLKDDMVALPEYSQCLATIEKDDRISSHFNEMVGTEELSERCSGSDDLMLRLPHLGIYQNKIEFNTEFFEREYKLFETEGHAPDFGYEAIIPLPGISFCEPIKLDETLEICRVVHSDLSAPIEDDLNDELLWSPLWAIRCYYRIPKIVGENDPLSRVDGSKRNKEIRTAVNHKMEGVIACLRLIGAQNVYAAQIVHRTRSWFFQHSHPYPVRYIPQAHWKEDLSSDYKDALINFWMKFESESVQNRRRIVTAARRFSLAHERYDWEDQIIDLLIAGEALFLTENTEGELTYRLRLHSALFLSSEPTERKRIFDDMGRAYNLRSGIVHGSADLTKRIRKIEAREIGQFGDEYRLREFIFRIQTYIRLSIFNMVMLAFENPDQHPLVDWEAMALSNADSIVKKP